MRVRTGGATALTEPVVVAARCAPATNLGCQTVFHESPIDETGAVVAAQSVGAQLERFVELAGCEADYAADLRRVAAATGGADWSWRAITKNAAAIANMSILSFDTCIPLDCGWGRNFAVAFLLARTRWGGDATRR